MHVFVVFLHIEFFRFDEQLFHALFAQQFDERFAFRHRFVRPEECQGTFFLYFFVFAVDFLSGFGQQLRSHAGLLFYQHFDARSVFFE